MSVGGRSRGRGDGGGVGGVLFPWFFVGAGGSGTLRNEMTTGLKWRICNHGSVVGCGTWFLKEWG